MTWVLVGSLEEPSPAALPVLASEAVHTGILELVVIASRFGGALRS